MWVSESKIKLAIKNKISEKIKNYIEHLLWTAGVTKKLLRQQLAESQRRIQLHNKLFAECIVPSCVYLHSLHSLLLCFSSQMFKKSLLKEAALQILRHFLF